MKILYFNWRDIKNPKSGGAEVLSHHIAKRWVEKGHEVTLFSSFFKGATREEIVDGVRIIRAGNAVTVYWQAYRHYNKFFKGKVDVVIDEINTIPFFTPLYVKDPLVCHINQLAKEVWFCESHWPIAVLGYLVEPALLRLYKKELVMTISESTKEDLLKLGFDGGKTFVIPMGVDFAPIEYVMHKEKNPTLIYVGRLKKSKRVHHIIEAFKIIKKEIPSCKLWIVGNGDEHYKKRLYRAAQQTEGIEFFHNISNEGKLEKMRRAHAVIVTSVREGWGLIVTEANACGTPAIGYNVPGLKDSIKDGMSGILCKRNNSRELAETIAGFLSDEKLTRRFAERALEDSRQYHWDRTARECLEVIAKISSEFAVRR